MRKLLLITFFMSGSLQASALVISEVMSNPIGDDSGREWIELYNNASTSVDLSALTISVKGGTPTVVTSLSGGTTIGAGGYAVIGSTVSGSTKFLQDYGTYSGALFKSAISLVNSGVTSLDIRLAGSVVDSLPSYTAAKEGSSLALIGGSFVAGVPTPGADNQPDTSSNSPSGSGTSATSTGTQVSVPQMSPPVADIVFYLPFDKTVIAGAEADFSTYATTHAGTVIPNLSCVWAFGDGGQATGTSTTYRYAYTGRYVAQVEGTNGLVAGTARMNVRVVPPDISISGVGSGKYGAYVDITNPNTYDLDLSQWRLSINGQVFPFPKNTLILANGVTRFSGLAMGFSKLPVSASSTVKILFPNQEEVTMYQLPAPLSDQGAHASSTTVVAPLHPSTLSQAATQKGSKIKSIASSSSTLPIKVASRDTRFISWVKAFLGH
jgi:hypothetical protein